MMTTTTTTTTSDENDDWFVVDFNAVSEQPEPISIISNGVPPISLVPSAPVKCGLASSPSSANIPQINLGQYLKQGDGIAIKPSAKNEIRHVKHKAIRQFVYSVLRNTMCWLFVICCIVLAVESRNGIKTWLHDERFGIVVLLIVGLLGVPFQAIHIVREVRNKKPSLVAWMLRNSHNIADFKQMVTERQMSPPYIAVEIAIKSGVIAETESDPNHWMKTSRRNIKILRFDSWMDVSSPINEQKWDDFDAFWIILSKNYRFMDRYAQATIQKEVAQFKKDCEFEKFMYRMTFQYILDVQEGDYFPDAEACLVYKAQKPKLYDWTMYMVFLCLASDFIYQIMLFSRTKFAKDYYFIKFIERNADSSPK